MQSKLYFIGVLLTFLIRFHPALSQEVLIGYSPLFNYNTIPPLNVAYSPLFTFNSSSPALAGISPLFNFDTRKIILNPEAIYFGELVVSNCATQNYLLSGRGLTAGISITTPAGFQVSLQNNSGFSNSLLVQQVNGIINQNIYLRFCPSNAQIYEGSVLHSSPNAISQNLAVSGSGVLSAPLVFNVSGGGSYCQGVAPSGISVLLDGSQPGVNYQLLKDGNLYGVPLPGTGAPLTWFDLLGGLYTVMASNATQSSLMNGSASIIELEVLPVSVGISAQATFACEGSMIDLLAVPINGGTNPLYQWKVNGISQANGASFSYTPQNNDIVTVELLSNEVCTSNNPATSDPLVLSVSPVLPVSVTIVGENIICEGTEVSFTALPVNGGTNPSFQWFVNGNPNGSSNASFSYIPQNQDAVSLTMTSNEVCTTNNPASSNIISMSVNPIPIVTWNDFQPDTLCISWEPVLLYGGFPVGGTYSGIGVVNNFFHPSIAGIGMHMLTYSYSSPFDCQADATINVFVDNCTSIKDLTNKPFLMLYPNPAKKHITAQLSHPIIEDASIMIVNIFGQVVMVQQARSGSEFVLDVSTTPSGIYFLHMRGNTDHLIKSFIISR